MENTNTYEAWWRIHHILALRRLKQNRNFKASLGYETLSQKNNY